MGENKRKGARSIKEIPAEIVEQLNRGEMETANLVEWLAININQLLENLLTQQNRREYLEPILERINRLKKQTINTRNKAIGTGLLEEATARADNHFLTTIATHTSDTVRCWAAYTVGKNPALSLQEKLRKIQPFAADSHFGVREVAWMAVRKDIAENLTASIKILSAWTTHADKNIRRFASEATRPRGVWCEHIEALKQNPELGLPLLENLKSDEEKYVQDSVGNWLNDASKTKPEMVRNVCKRWESESDTKATKYILKKALRTLEK